MMTHDEVIAEVLKIVNDRRLTIKYEHEFYVLMVVDNADLMSYPYSEDVNPFSVFDGDEPGEAEVEDLIFIAEDMLSYQRFRIPHLIAERITDQIFWRGDRLDRSTKLPPKVV